MKPANPRPLLVFYILVSYVLIQFVWWSYLLIEQNNELYTLKKSFNLLTYNDPQLIIEEGNAQASTIARKKLDEVKEKIGLL